MTDDSPSPEADAVRRLLAASRHDEPMPADVADRMDRVLADLAATPALGVAGPSSAAETSETETTSDGVITRLPVQRRRRAGGLLAAAAAIVVGGVVLAQHLPHGTSDGEESAGSAAGSQLSAGNTGNTGSAPAAAASLPAGKLQLDDGRLVVRRQSFARDALKAQALLARRGPHRLPLPAAACPTPSGHDQVVPALYHRAPAALVFHLPDGSTQVVDLLVCGTQQPVLSVTLPAP